MAIQERQRLVEGNAQVWSASGATLFARTEWSFCFAEGTSRRSQAGKVWTTRSNRSFGDAESSE